MNLRKYISITSGLAIATSVALAIPVFAQTTNQPNNAYGQRTGQMGQGRFGEPSGMAGGLNRGAGMMRSGVFGTVAGVNGDIVTVSGHTGFGTTTATVTYAVDATNATIRKNNATSTVTSIVVGDTVSVRGTVTGTNVTATSINDGVMGTTGMRRPGSPGQENQSANGKSWTATSTAQIIGNGQPVIAGTVSVVNGTTLTVTTASNVTYTVDASGAKVLQGQNVAASLSSVVVGNKVLVQGTVNGTSITASTIIDQSLTTGGGTQSPKMGMEQPRGVLASIGQFFMHIFGF